MVAVPSTGGVDGLVRLNSLLHHFNVAALRPRAAANSAAVFPLDRHSRTRPFHVADGQQLRVTCSLGVVTLGTEASVHEFVDAADQALLEAKRMGKNVVRAAR